MEAKEQQEKAQEVLELFKGKTLNEIKKTLRIAIEIAEDKSILS